MGRPVRRARARALLPRVANETVNRVETRLIEHFAAADGRTPADQLERAGIARRLTDIGQAGHQFFGRTVCHDVDSERSGPFSAVEGAAREKLANVPCSAISFAASKKPAHAARASAPPTLMRRTPRDASSATVVKPELARTLTGRGATAFTSSAICAVELRPGAYRPSAPASA